MTPTVLKHRGARRHYRIPRDVGCAYRAVVHSRFVKASKTIVLVALASIALLLGPAGSTGAKEKQKYPYAWGMLTENSGCVIFGEARHKHTRFVGAVEVSWDGTLDVIETKNYDMKQREWKERREDLDALQKLALKDKLKLIKIPAKHTQQQLEEARGMCGVVPTAPAAGH
jgi:hypothetical protein